MVLLLSGCAQTSSYPETRSLAANHRLIAIIPPKVEHRGIKRTKATAGHENQERASLQFHQLMYSWMLKEKTENRVFVDVQRVNDTNQRLEAAGYFDGEALTPAQICDILGVDAILVANFTSNKTMTDTESLVTGMVLRGIGPFNRGTQNNKMALTLELFDKGTQDTIWTYTHKLSGDARTTPAMLVNKLMKSAKNKMPYYYPKGSPKK
ncbi:hypothetical protein [Telluribacter sp.]|jgi:hypothetical protein|uniref:hypothetical protein n=1 Tax=Telluribacter sp. TaxID=1978767 RepID=UPI002E146533|nr:hypothetical protein [Telluribacter sp.]